MKTAQQRFGLPYKGFYDQLFPLIQPDMFSQEEKATKDEQIKRGYFL